MPPWPRLGLSPRGRKDSHLPTSPIFKSEFHILLFPTSLPLCSFLPSCGAIMLWPGAQQQPSGNGLRLLRELPVHFAIDYRGWTPIPLPLVPPCASLFISAHPQSKRLFTGLSDCIKYTAVTNCPCGHIPHVCTVSDTQMLLKQS